MCSQGSPGDSNVHPGLRTTDVRTHPGQIDQMIPMGTGVDEPLTYIILCEIILTSSRSGHIPRGIHGHRELTSFTDEENAGQRQETTG